jgi:integrase
MARTAHRFNIESRNGSRRVVVRVPKDVRPIIGKAYMIQCLGKMSLQKAVVAGEPFAEHFHQQIAAARNGTFVPPTPEKLIAAVASFISGEPTPAHPRKTPPLEITEPKDDGAVTVKTLIAAWIAERKITSASSIQRAERAFRMLADVIGHNDPEKVTPKDIVQFRVSLRNGTDPRTKKRYHPNTIIAYQHALQGVFSVAVETLKLDRSPFDKIRIGNKTESERRAYSFEQVTTILNAAFQSTYDVFLPVLVQAYCGCRVSEIVDATTHDIVQIDGQWCRTVPLHHEIVRYLIPYWQSLPPGPLFPKLPKAKKNNARSAYVARKIQEWIREDLLIKDPNLAPNHSFRHYLKSQLLDRDVQERVSDAITGHKTPGIGRKYEHVELSKRSGRSINCR